MRRNSARGSRQDSTINQLDKLEVTGSSPVTPISSEEAWEAKSEAAQAGGHWAGANGQRTPRWGYMYFIGAEQGPIKVGWTKETAKSRLRSLQTGNPAKLEIYGVIKCPKSFEAATHERLSYCRIRGEWFDRHEALAELSDLCLQVVFLGCVAELADRYPWRRAFTVTHEEALDEVDRAFAEYEAKHGPILHEGGRE